MKQRTPEEMREYQRQRRRIAGVGHVTPDVTPDVVTPIVTPAVTPDVTPVLCNCKRWGEGIPVYIPPHSVADHDAAHAGKAVAVPSACAPLFVGAVTRPKEATDAEWNYALQRADRATRYATKFPDHVLAADTVFQSPIWQLENMALGR
jgi:hypothetical protein